MRFKLVIRYRYCITYYYVHHVTGDEAKRYLTRGWQMAFAHFSFRRKY
jgi:hypothetical protein